MLLRKGKAKYLLPPVGQMVTAALDRQDGTIRVLLHIDLETLLNTTENKAVSQHGDPTHFAMNGRYIHLFPCPNDAAKLIVRFYPPMVEV